MFLRKSAILLLLVILLSPGVASATVSVDDSQWQFVAPGIDFRKYTLPDPNNVFVARMDRNNQGVILESTLAQGNIAEGRETVSGMYRRYDQAINFWGASTNPPSWGTRNKVVVAINGSYFDLQTGIPQGGQVQDGWYIKRYTNLGGWGGFAWKLDRSAFISECLYHDPARQFITFPMTGKTMTIGTVNKPGGAYDLDMYTPQYDSRTGTDDSGVEVLVEMTYPSMIFPKPAGITGIVRQINIGHGDSPIPFNSVVLSAGGNTAKTLLENISVGSEIKFSQEITSFEYDCTTPYYLSWTKTFASLQGAFFFLKDGQIREFDHDAGATGRRPRTAIAFNDQYIYFLVVDGRDYYHSVGMTIYELAEFVRDTLGATWGVAQDGGGSSTMVINGGVVNNTYCNIYSCAGYYTPVIPVNPSEKQKDEVEPPPNSLVVSSSAGIERTVANGMLMVLVQPPIYSAAFKPYDLVTTSSAADMRLGPGTNYASFANVPQGARVVVREQLNGLYGIWAKSSYWWYVDYGGVLGWIPEDALLYLPADSIASPWFILPRTHGR